MRSRAMLFLVVAAFLVVAPVVHADGSNGGVTVTFTNVNGANNGAFYVSPYTGTITGPNGTMQVTLYCVDFNNEVTFGQTWQANVTPLSGNLNNTRYGNPTIVQQLSATDPYYASYTPQQLYAQAAWLTTQMAQYMSPNYLTNPTDVNALIAIQYAIWDLFDPQAPTNSAAQQWILLAESNFSSINLNDFELITNTGTLAMTGQVQEFLVETPEPGSLTLLGAGMLVFGFLIRRKGSAANAQRNAAA